LSKLLAKQYYLEQLEKGKSHRQISKNIKAPFSGSDIRDSLLADNIIVLTHKEVDPKTLRTHVYYKITGNLPAKVDANFWDDGTPKSRGNAFDITLAKGLFTKAEKAASQNKGKPLNYNVPIQVIAYSRA
jgi:hypothetical protein